MSAKWTIFKREETMFDRIKLNVAAYGEWYGLAIVFIVSMWDLAYTGVRGFPEYRIGPLGVVAIWLGLGLIFMARRWDKDFRK